MRELGHMLGIGWTDDTPIVARVGLVAKGMEVYSGDVSGDVFEPDLTPEYVDTGVGSPDPEWGIMMAGTAQDSRAFTNTSASFPVFRFSIEELSTIDFGDIPSRED